MGGAVRVGPPPGGGPPQAMPRERTSFGADMKALYGLRNYFIQFLPRALLVLGMAYLYADLNSTAITGLQQITSALPRIVSGASGAIAPGAGPARSVSGKLLALLNLNSTEQWLPLLSILVLLFVIGGLIQLARDVLRSRVGISLKREIREDVLRCLYREPATARVQRGSGASAEILRTDADGTASLLTTGVLGLMEAVVLFIVFARTLVTQVQGGWVILGAFISLSVLAQIVSMLVTQRAERRAFEESRTALGGAAAITTRFFDVLRDLLYLGGEKTKGQAVVDAWTTAETKNVAIRVWTGVRGIITQTFQHLNLPLIILVIAKTGGDAGGIIGGMALLGQLATPFATLVSFPSLLLQFGPNLHSIHKILATPDPGEPPAAATQLAGLAKPPALAVRDLHFAYPGAATAIVRGVSFDIPPGARVGIVGGSGCGKTSLARVLAGDYQASAGSFLVDGVDVTHWPLQWKRSAIALLTDAPGFLLETLRENVLFGRECPPDRLDYALKVSGAADVAARLPDGLNTVLASEVPLSGGQRRKVSLARGLAGPQRVLILDEPLAQVDPEGMRELASRVLEATEGRTCLIITHDMDVLATDFNIFLEAGKVAAVGPHEELLRTCPAYAELTDRSAGARTQRASAG